MSQVSKDISTLSGLINGLVDVIKLINKESFRISLDGNLDISNI